MSITKQDIERSKLEFKQMVKNDWVKDRDAADDYVKGRTKEYTSQYMNDQAKLEVPIENNNVTKRVIDRISLVYSVEAKRKYFNGDKEVEELPEAYTKAIKFKDEQLHIAEKRTNLLRLIGIKPTMRDFVFDYDILTEFEPHFGKDPLVPIGVSYPLPARASVRDNTPELWVYLTAEDYLVYVRKTNTVAKEEFQIFPDLKNPYGILPIVWVFDEKPELSFLDIDPANDLVQMNEAINVIGTASNANVIYQSYGYLVATGLDKGDEKKLKVGPNKITALKRDQDLKFITPPDTLMSVTENVKAKMQFVTSNYHLPHGFIIGEEIAESGTAIKERNRELQDERKGDVVRWRNTEELLYEVEKVIVGVDLNTTIPERMAVDFSETLEILTPQEQMDKWDWQREHGYISDAEIFMLLDPDRFETIEDAQTQIDDNKAAGQTEMETPLTTFLAQTPTEGE